MAEFMAESARFETQSMFSRLTEKLLFPGINNFQRHALSDKEIIDIHCLLRNLF